MKFYKLREVMASESRVVYGITVPEEVVTLFGAETKFRFEISGNIILLHSGTGLSITKKDVEDFNLNSIRV
jgi:hypothetical protein